MKEIKELFQATATLFGHLFVSFAWVIILLACVALIFAAPILAVAGIYKVICLICHMAFCWEIPIIIGAMIVEAVVLICT